MLGVLGSIYGRIADSRNRLYDMGVFETFDLGARVISVGNITTGGTGKTPLVVKVTEILSSRGEKVCILTRGYGRTNPNQRVLVSDGEQILAGPHKSGDEPFELASKLLGMAIVIADADRVAAADWAKRKFGVTTYVLDDGFQHRRAKRNVDIVCIDATNPFGGGKMLPAGRLREPLGNLRRANLIVITRANLVDEISNLKSEILEMCPASSIFLARNKVKQILEIGDFHAKTQRTQRKDTADDCFVFCGIGNPDSFYQDLHLAGINTIDMLAFDDHHSYSQRDIEKIEQRALSLHAKVLVTTVKDAVKLTGLKFTLPCYVVEVEMMIDDEKSFAAIL